MVQKEIQLAFLVEENEDKKKKKRDSWLFHSPVSTSASGHQQTVKENKNQNKNSIERVIYQHKKKK